VTAPAPAASAEAAPPTPNAAPPALWFGGDVHFGASGTVGLGDIAASLAGAAGVVNLEGPIGVGGAEDRGGDVGLSNPPDSGERLRAMGVLAVSVANNHAGDEGDAGRLLTRATLERAGVAAAGDSAVSFSVDGHPLRLLAVDLAAGDAPARISAGFGGGEGQTQVVSLHVTGPASYLPSPALQDAVAAAVAAGADIVVAHGTHVVGPVERRGDTVVAWGLGNLLFNCPCTGDDEALILRVELAPGLPATVIPVRAGLGGRSARLHEDRLALFTLLDGLGGARVGRGARPGGF
jgi:hypothetical protein